MRDFVRLGGGKAANVAWLARRFGVEATLIARVGDDDHAELALAPLREAGVDLAGVRLERQVAPPQLEVADTTGAGDASAAALAVALIEGRPLVDAAERAVITTPPGRATRPEPRWKRGFELAARRSADRRVPLSHAVRSILDLTMSSRAHRGPRG